MADVVANVLVGVAEVFYHTTPGTAPASVSTEFGYTNDGISWTYTNTSYEVEVEESTWPLKPVITKESFEVTINCAESLLANLQQAMAGALTGGAGIIDLGGGAMQDIALKIIAPFSAGHTLTIYVPYAAPVGSVNVAYKKGEKTIIPITFRAYRGVAGADVVTFTEA